MNVTMTIRFHTWFWKSGRYCREGRGRDSPVSRLCTGMARSWIMGRGVCSPRHRIDLPSGLYLLFPLPDGSNALPLDTLKRHIRKQAQRHAHPRSRCRKTPSIRESRHFLPSVTPSVLCILSASRDAPFPKPVPRPIYQSPSSNGNEPGCHVLSSFQKEVTCIAGRTTKGRR